MQKVTAMRLAAVVAPLWSCADAPDARIPTAPTASIGAMTPASVDRSAVDSLASSIALALANSTVRERLRDDLRDSPFPAHALELGSYLKGASGKALAGEAARAMSMSPSEFLLFVSKLPTLEIEMERPIDRVRWVATPDVVVYGSPITGVERVKAAATATGFNTRGDTVSIPVWTAGSSPYLLIMPSDVAFGKDPESRRASAPHHTRPTISTQQDEIAQTMSPAALASSAARAAQSYIITKPCNPDTDPNCGGGGGGGGYDTDGTRLPAQFTPGYCFGWASWGAPPLDVSNDKDADGLRDDCEYELAWAFRPMLARKNHDDAPGKEPYWSVTRIPGTVTGVRIFYALSYYRDAGEHDTHVTSHDGDSEFIIVEIQNDMNPYDYTLWELNQATLSAHWMAGAGVDHTSTYAASDLEYPSVYRGRPRIWASWDKHGNYRSKSVCNSQWNDVCDTIFTGTTYDDLDIGSDANLGNSFNVSPANSSTRLTNCTSSRHPGTGGAGYGIECFWEDATPFAGWNVYSGQASATAYRTMLSYYQF